MDTARSTSIFNKSGKLKVQISACRNLPAKFEGQWFSCNAEFDDGIGPTFLREATNGVVQWEAGFPFDLTEDSDHEVKFALANEEGDSLDTAFCSLKEVMRNGRHSATLKFQKLEDALLDVIMVFVEKPHDLPDNIEITLRSAKGLVGAGASAKSPYCKVLLDDELLGQTTPVQNGGSTLNWNQSVRGKYDGSQLLVIQCYDEDAQDELLGEASLDLWDIVKTPQPWFKEGELSVSHEEDPRHTRGFIILAVRMWNNPPPGQPAEIPKTPRVENPVSSETSRSSSVSSRSSSSAPGAMRPEDAQRGLGRANKLADEAEADAARARSAADAAKRTAQTQPLSDQAHRHAQDAEHGAATAVKAAGKAKEVLKDLEEAVNSKKGVTEPHLKEDLDALHRHADDARDGKEKARAAARNGACASAENAARVAQAASAETHDIADAAEGIRDAWPEEPELEAIAREIKKMAQEAAQLQRVARAAADECAATDRLDDALEAAANARKAAREALKIAEDAAGKLKRAQKVANKCQKYEDKRNARKLAREKERAEQERLRKERSRNAAHDREHEKRMKDLNAVDVNEQRMQLEAIGTSFHAKARGLSPRSPRIACCGSPTAASEGGSSEHSFSPNSPSRLPLRGKRGNTRDFLADTSPIGDIAMSPMAEHSAYATVGGGAVFAPRKPWCWCFGCQCCHCCGEC